MTHQLHSLEQNIASPKRLETGFRTISAEILYTLLLRIEAIGLSTFGLLQEFWVCWLRHEHRACRVPKQT